MRVRLRRQATPTTHMPQPGYSGCEILSSNQEFLAQTAENMQQRSTAGIEPRHLLGRELLAEPVQVDRGEAVNERVAAVAVDVLPGHGGDTLAGDRRSPERRGAPARPAPRTGSPRHRCGAWPLGPLGGHSQARPGQSALRVRSAGRRHLVSEPLAGITRQQCKRHGHQSLRTNC